MSGVINRFVDYLSRWYLDEVKYFGLFVVECGDVGFFSEEIVIDELFVFNSDL